MTLWHWILFLLVRSCNQVDTINGLRRPLGSTSQRIIAAARAKLAAQASDNPA